MGVMNITPNSFSDGISDQNPLHFKNRLKGLSLWASVIDIGAESTAPFNDSISLELEKDRFDKNFFSLIGSLESANFTISIDTYKIELFDYVAKKILSLNPNIKLIFNDVSGCLDEKLIQYLKTSNIPFQYVFSHNLCTERSDTGNHMDYVSSISDDELFCEVVNYFKAGIKALKASGREIIIDPCFGFSKSREQNQFLVKRFPDIVKELCAESRQFMFGVSRKSFMRFPVDLDAKSSEGQKSLDNMQSILLFNVIKELREVDVDIITRSHGRDSFVAIENVSQILSL